MCALLPACGCASMQDFTYRQSHRAKAFCSSYWTWNAPILNCDYTDGWRTGYFDYSTGRRCKPPVLPPHKYWSSCYQSCKGQKEIAEWYRGYEAGMIEAEKRCGNCFHQIRPHGDCETHEGPLASHLGLSPSGDSLPMVESIDVPAQSSPLPSSPINSSPVPSPPPSPAPMPPRPYPSRSPTETPTVPPIPGASELPALPLIEATPSPAWLAPNVPSSAK